MTPSPHGVCASVGIRPYIPLLDKNTSAPFDIWAKSASRASQQYHTKARQRMLREELAEGVARRRDVLTTTSPVVK